MQCPDDICVYIITLKPGNAFVQDIGLANAAARPTAYPRRRNDDGQCHAPDVRCAAAPRPRC